MIPLLLYWLHLTLLYCFIVIEDHLGKHNDWGKFFVVAGFIAVVIAIGSFVNFEKLPESTESKSRDEKSKAVSDAGVRVDTPQPLV